MLRNKLGFTLIELLVVITIISIGITLAVPSWERASQKRRLTNAAEQVAAFLITAQSQAQKRNRPVSLSYHHSGDHNWCVGAVLGAVGCDCTETDTSSAQYCSIDGITSSIQTESFPSLSLIAASDGRPVDGDSYITFDPIRGILQPTGDKLSFTFESAGGYFQLQLRVSPTGLLTICNPDESREVGGYFICAA